MIGTAKTKLAILTFLYCGEIVKNSFTLEDSHNFYHMGLSLMNVLGIALSVIKAWL